MKGGGASVALLAPERPGTALVGSGPADADRLLPWDAPRLSWLFGGDPPSSPSGDRFDLAVVYSRNAALVERMAALAIDVRRWDPEPPPNQGHASLWLARPIRALGFHVEATPPAQVPTAQETTEARALAAGLPHGFLAIHPGSGSPRKNWAAGAFAEVVRRVSPRRPWLLLEGPADATAAAALSGVPGAVRLQEPPLRVLGALLSGAGAYVGNDSGVSHLAAAWGAPTVALFGPTDPSVWAPLGPRVEVVRNASSDLAAISVDAVAAAVERVRSAALGRPSG